MTRMKGYHTMLRTLFTQFTPAGSGFAGRAVRRAVARAASLAAITVLAIGTLSGTAQAQSIFADLRVNHFMATVPKVSGGDADVYSKSGRYTDVLVQTGQPYVYPGGLSGYIAVQYEVREGASNYTMLRKTDIVPFYAPPGYRIASIGINRRPAYFSRRYAGEDHNWHNESGATVGTYLQSLYTKFDGPGRDDQGNAALTAEIWIGVELVRN
jgi:hypothetical protein